MDWGSNGRIDGSGNISNYSVGNTVIGYNNAIEANNCRRNLLLGRENRISTSGAENSIIIGRENIVSGVKKALILGNNNSNVRDGQIIIGSYANTSGNETFIVGNGTSGSALSNLFTVDSAGILKCTNIPAAPSTDGTYALATTISSGTATYAWEAKKYLHNITFESGAIKAHFTIRTSDAAAYTTATDLFTAMAALGLDSGVEITATGVDIVSTTIYSLVSASLDTTADEFIFYGIDLSDGSLSDIGLSKSAPSITVSDLVM